MRRSHAQYKRANIKEPSNWQLHDHGRLIAAEAACNDGAPGVALMILAGTVQVAARRTGDWQLSNVDRPVADRVVAVVFVDLTGDEPGFYVVPAG